MVISRNGEHACLIHLFIYLFIYSFIYLLTAARSLVSVPVAVMVISRNGEDLARLIYSPSSSLCWDTHKGPTTNSNPWRAFGMLNRSLILQSRRKQGLTGVCFEWQYIWISIHNYSPCYLCDIYLLQYFYNVLTYIYENYQNPVCLLVILDILPSCDTHSTQR